MEAEVGREVPESVAIPDDASLATVGLDRLRPDDEVYQHVPENPAEWATYVMDADGLPKPQTPTDMPFAPPLTTSNLVCIEDTSEFVIRNRWGDVVARFTPEQVERAPSGQWRVSLHHALAGLGVDASAGRDLLSDRLGKTLSECGEYGVVYDNAWCEVEPLRPMCKHYARQLTDFQDNDEHVFVARLCTGRRDDGGEFLSLRDSQTFACTMRCPRDAVSEARADLLDANKIRLGAARIAAGDGFDVDAHLNRMLEGEDATGIFTGPDAPLHF